MNANTLQALANDPNMGIIYDTNDLSDLSKTGTTEILSPSSVASPTTPIVVEQMDSVTPTSPVTCSSRPKPTAVPDEWHDEVLSVESILLAVDKLRPRLFDQADYIHADVLEYLEIFEQHMKQAAQDAEKPTAHLHDILFHRVTPVRTLMALLDVPLDNIASTAARLLHAVAKVGVLTDESPLSIDQVVALLKESPNRPAPIQRWTLRAVQAVVSARAVPSSALDTVVAAMRTLPPAPLVLHVYDALVAWVDEGLRTPAVKALADQLAVHMDTGPYPTLMLARLLRSVYTWVGNQPKFFPHATPSGASSIPAQLTVLLDSRGLPNALTAQLSESTDRRATLACLYATDRLLRLVMRCDPVSTVPEHFLSAGLPLVLGYLILSNDPHIAATASRVSMLLVVHSNGPTPAELLLCHNAALLGAVIRALASPPDCTATDAVTEASDAKLFTQRQNALAMTLVGALVKDTTLRRSFRATVVALNVRNYIPVVGDVLRSVLSSVDLMAVNLPINSIDRLPGSDPENMTTVHDHVMISRSFTAAISSDDGLIDAQTKLGRITPPADLVDSIVDMARYASTGADDSYIESYAKILAKMIVKRAKDVADRPVNPTTAPAPPRWPSSGDGKLLGLNLSGKEVSVLLLRQILLHSVHINFPERMRPKARTKVKTVTPRRGAQDMQETDADTTGAGCYVAWDPILEGLAAESTPTSAESTPVAMEASSRVTGKYFASRTHPTMPIAVDATFTEAPSTPTQREPVGPYKIRAPKSYRFRPDLRAGNVSGSATIFERSLRSSLTNSLSKARKRVSVEPDWPIIDVAPFTALRSFEGGDAVTKLVLPLHKTVKELRRQISVDRKRSVVTPMRSMDNEARSALRDSIHSHKAILDAVRRLIHFIATGSLDLDLSTGLTRLDSDSTNPSFTRLAATVLESAVALHFKMIYDETTSHDELLRIRADVAAMTLGPSDLIGVMRLCIRLQGTDMTIGNLLHE
ncbi:hypothetical protein J8273_8025 [Carpediemonas membranifera]|uniref:Uncharacterized protein n=1 Tax=Carpediemonas membranifera TaxID=201153 RepID=A0A8J6B118_9EUKA|nr:hypothetical protein J8273_8025 [Carpediemonas membranifera]|eukprot:KAG9390659.1 hypothetical protein J8273_8025 [Carpediemonas membranifera]